MLIALLHSPLTSSWPIFVLASAAILAGALMQGASGIGLGMVAAPVLIFIDPHIGPGPLLMLALVISGVMLRREHAAVDRPGLGLTLVGRVIGSIIAGAFYALLPTAYYGLVFGVLILVGVALSMFGYEVKRSPARLIFAGACSGVMGTLTSVGDPAIALVFQKADGAVVRATLSAYFFFSSLISLAVLFATGTFSVNAAAASLALLPAMFIGFWLSGHLASRLAQDGTRRLVLAVSAASALLLIARAIATLR